MSNSRKSKLQHFLKLAEHPTDENNKVTDIYFREDRSFVEDIENNHGKNFLHLMKNLDKFPNLKALAHLDSLLSLLDQDAETWKPIQPTWLASFLSNFFGKPINPTLLEQQTLVAQMICHALESSTSLKQIELTGFLPQCIKQILTAINRSRAPITMLDFRGRSGYDRAALNEITGYLTKFFSSNTTVQFLDLYYTPLGESNGLKIMTSIFANPHSKINSLHIPEIGITAVAEKIIVDNCRKKKISLFWAEGNKQNRYVPFSEDLQAERRKGLADSEVIGQGVFLQSRAWWRPQKITLAALREHLSVYCPFYVDDAVASLAFTLIEHLHITNENELKDFLDIIPASSQPNFLKLFELQHPGKLSSWKHSANALPSISLSSTALTSQLISTSASAFSVEDPAEEVFLSPAETPASVFASTTRADNLKTFTL